MSKHESEIKEYVRNLTPLTQKRAIIAIEDLQRRGKDGEWINCALHKKSYSEWEKWGFGLMFNQRFQASVLKQIERDRRCSAVNVNKWLLQESISDDVEQYTPIQEYLEGVFSDNRPTPERTCPTSNDEEKDFEF